MTDQNTPEPADLPDVRLRLRNTSGEDDNLTLSNPLLGMHPFILLQTDEEGNFIVEASHLDADGLAGALAFVTYTLLLSDQVGEEVREEVFGIFDDRDSEVTTS